MKQIALLTLTIAASACFAQNLIVNGSFETGPAASTLNIQAGNTTALPGWEVIPGVGANPDRPSGRQSIDYAKLDWQAADGIACIELDGTTGPAGVRQVIPTLPGRRYQVRFFISAHPGVIGVPYSGRVNAGRQGTNFTVANPQGTTPQNLPWTEVLFVFRAVDASTAIDFRSLAAVEARNPDLETFFGVNIDNVSVELLPFSPALDGVTP